MKDGCNRQIDYLRISITDRCNLRCKYCIPEGAEGITDKSWLLTFEEIEEVVNAAAKLGIRNIKLTGGEPLVRRGCASLARKLKAIDGIESVTLTTNGVLLADKLSELKNAGVDSINVSLDTMDRDRFCDITGFDGLDKVLSAIDMAYEMGIRVKINAVTADFSRKLINEDGTFEMDEDLQKLINLSRDRDIDVRFIEIMPIGAGRNFLYVSNESLFSAVEEVYGKLSPDTGIHGNGPAVYYRIDGFKGSIGFISPMHGKFCSSCNRIRMSSMGYIKSCLCYGDGVDLRSIVRSDEDYDARQDKLIKALTEAIKQKPKEHCFEDVSQISEKKKMSDIGG